MEEELAYNEYDDGECYIQDDDGDAVSLEDSEDSDLCDEECKVCTEPDEISHHVLSATKERIGKDGQLKTIYMKKFIDAVNTELHEKNQATEKIREELNKCLDRIKELEKERDQVYGLVQIADENDDVPNSDRLRAQHERALLELDMERGIEEAIKARLEEAEYALALAELEKGKYMVQEDELHTDQEALRQQKRGDFVVRAAKEDTYTNATQRRITKTAQDQKEAIRHQERLSKQAKADAMKAKERNSKFLQRTMNEIREKNISDAQRSSADMNRRINAVLSLKNNITTNKENIDAIHARKKHLQNEALKADEQFMKQVTETGGDAATALLVKKRVEQMDQTKFEHENWQREAEMQIAAKVMLEDERFKRRKNMYPHLWGEKEWEQSLRVKPHKQKKLKTLEVDVNPEDSYDDYIAKLATLPKSIDAQRELSSPVMRGDSSDEENVTRLPAAELSSAKSARSAAEGGTNLAKPEFEGMWNKFERYVVPKETVVDVIKGSKVSKMDQDIMREKLKKQRDNITQVQIAGGREFKGKSSFNSKPDIVHFKDFDIGKTYKKKIVLTNVSYSINFCKLIDLSSNLKDFIEIQFEPPGQLSAGMTCELMVIFKPMINEDLDGQINFMSQTGPFVLPVRCSTKKCDLKVDMTEVNFGTSVIGETLKRHITLTNNGALGTRIMFGKYTGKDHHIVTAAPEDFAKKVSSPTSDDLGDNSPAPGSFGNYASKPGSAAASPPQGSEGQADDGSVQQMDDDVGSRAETSYGADLSDTHDQDLDGMMVSTSNSTYIGPFTQEKLEIVWQPTVPGKCDAQFIVSFEDELSEDITITSSGLSVDVPVYVTRQNIDLQICMYDRLYQDSVIVKNRATSALKLTFDVPRALRRHMELLPKTGFVQAQSSFSAQLKFLPRAGLAEDAGEYFDKETGVLEVPLSINVADQTRPVPFVVHAIVTNSDLEFNVKDIDFGHCTIFESVRTQVELTNHSILPQEFGFLGLPAYVDVQPDDGFGMLLPEETIVLDVIFSPPKAKNYSFDLSCKSLINREFKISCQGVGVHPPMELSDQVVHFKATSLNDYSLQDIYVMNNHLSTNEYTHPVPRIGRGQIAPVGPTSYEFAVPKDSPVELFPSVGTVKPGENQRVQVRFAPTLAVQKIKEEAVRVTVKKAEERALKEFEEKQRREKEEQEAQANKKKAAAKPTGKASPKNRGPRPGTGPEIDIAGPDPVNAPDISTIKVESDEYSSAHSTLLRQYPGEFHTYVIPCYLASGSCTKPGELSYSVHNTLYLEVHCPIVKPDVVVISDNGRTTIDYGDVSIGQQYNKTMTIQNISDKEIDLTGSLLDTTGPFEMRNPLRELPSDTSHSLIIRFAPLSSDVFQETLHIYGPTSTLHVNLRGKGVSPTIQLNLEDRVFDMGAVLVNEYVEKTFKIKNTSTLSVDYMIKFDSLSQLRHRNMQQLPEFVKGDNSKPHVVGTQNFNGKCVFDCVPYAGKIPGGGTEEVTLTFAPDHASDYYSDGVHVELFNMEEAYSFQVSGEAKDHIMYVTGGEVLQPNVESLLPLPHVEPDEDTKPIAGHILLMFYSVAQDGVFSTTTADVAVGCVRTMAVSQKKNGEYSFENMNLINAKGFTISEPKAYLEAGTKKNVTITWCPPETHNPDEAVEATILVTTKCEIAESYQILLRGLIVSKAPEVEEVPPSIEPTTETPQPPASTDEG